MGSHSSVAVFDLRQGSNLVRTLLVGLFAATFTFLPVGTPHAQPLSGRLTGDDNRFLVYQCEQQDENTVACDFTFIEISHALEFDDLEAFVAQRLPSAIEEVTDPQFDEVCAFAGALPSLLTAIRDGDYEAAEQIASPFSGYDLGLALRRYEAIGGERFARDERLAREIVELCSDRSPEAVERFIRWEAERETATCRMRVTQIEHSFSRVSGNLWARIGQPEGAFCPGILLHRFQCREDFATLCDFVWEYRNLAPAAQSRLSDQTCSEEFPDSVIHYAFDPQGIPISCEAIRFD